MSKSYPIFTIADLFYRKFDERNIKKLIDISKYRSTPLVTQLTLGDVAIHCGPHEAWICSFIYDEIARKDIIKTILPSIKKARDKEIQTEIYSAVALSLIERFVNDEFVRLEDLKESTVTISKMINWSVTYKAIHLLLKCCYEPIYGYNILQVTNIFKNQISINQKEIDLQVADICSVFKPITKTVQSSHL